MTIGPSPAARMADSASSRAHGDRDALAGGQAIGLDDDRDREAIERGQRRRHRLDAHIVGGRNAGAGAQVLGEALGPFQLGGGGARPEGGDAGLAQGVGDARHQRRFRPDDDQVRIDRSRQGDHGRGVAGIDRDAFGPARNARDCPGAATRRSQEGDCFSRHASASSRPPEPSSRMFMDVSDPASDDDRPGLLAKVSPTDNSPPLSVSELSGALKRTVESAFGFVRVRGEISGWKRHASGHCYFTLKDDSACIDAVIWRGQAAGLAFQPADGLEVIATGKLTTYAGRSKYQIVVDRLELAGEGALMALLEQRRRALAAEGLFDSARKRPLPYLPRVIGVVTSPTGAVIRDILHRLRGPLSGACHALAGAGAGRGRRGKGRGRDPRLRVDRATPRPADRRARRRVDRGFVGVQRGRGGARRRRIRRSR